MWGGVLLCYVQIALWQDLSTKRKKKVTQTGIWFLEVLALFLTGYVALDKLLNLSFLI